MLEHLRHPPRRRGTRSSPTEEALPAANELGYPVLVRPSYVLGGQGMEIAYNDREHRGLHGASSTTTAQEHPILVDKYLMGTRAGSGRRLRRRGYPDPRHHGARGAGRHPLRRLHLRLSALHICERAQGDHPATTPEELARALGVRGPGQHPVSSSTTTRSTSSRSTPAPPAPSPISPR